MSLFLRIIVIRDEDESVDDAYARKQLTSKFIGKTNERRKEILK